MYTAFRPYFLMFPFCILLCAGCNRKGDEQQTTREWQVDTTVIGRLFRQGNHIVLQAPDSARALFRQALQKSRDIHYDQGTAHLLMALGTAYTDIGEYDSAMLYYREGLQYARLPELEHSALAQMLHQNIAAVYVYQGDYQSAIDWSLKALKNMKQHADYPFMIKVYSNIGAMFYHLGEYDKSRYYYDKGKDVAFKTDKPGQFLSLLYLNEARLLLDTDNLEAAREKCQQALVLLKEYPSVKRQCMAYRTLGSIYSKAQDWDRAIASFNAVLDIEAELPLYKLLAADDLGRLYLIKEDVVLAEKYLLRAQDMALQLNLPKELSSVYQHLGELYQKIGKYAEAMGYMNKYIRLHDSVWNIEKVNAVNQLEVKYRTARKDKELAEHQLLIARQRVNITRKNVWIWSMTAGTVVAIVGFSFFFYARQRSQRQVHQLAILRATSEGEEKERSRIAHNLHDGVGGQLSSLKMHLGILENKLPAVRHMEVYQEANRLLDDTVQTVRMTAHSLMPELLLKHGLSEATRIYCHAVQGKANEQLRIHYQHYGFIEGPDKHFELLVYRIIQELVQNVIKHAKADFVLVQLSQHNDLLDLTVEDNGKGMPQPNQTTGGMGLENIRRRVRELQGSFHINSAPGAGTTIYIAFDLKYQKKASNEA